VEELYYSKKFSCHLIVQHWIVDFCERIKQMQCISKQFYDQSSKSLKNCVVWLGGLFTPEAYITATRQFVAQANSWPLEKLYLKMNVYNTQTIFIQFRKPQIVFQSGPLSQDLQLASPSPNKPLQMGSSPDSIFRLQRQA
jgi:hypothetical protein